MKNNHTGLFKRIVSGFSALALLASNVLPVVPIMANAEDEENEAIVSENPENEENEKNKLVNPAHTINVFDIDIRSGAEYYSTYTPDDPSDTGKDTLTGNGGKGVYVWQAENSNDGHKFVYNIKFSISGEGTTDIDNNSVETAEAVNEDFIEIRIPAHILKYKGVVEADSNGVYPDELEMPVPSIDLIETKVTQKTDKDGNPIYDEDGNPVYETEYVTNHQFVYRIDDKGTPNDESDDEYIIYNINPVSAGVVYELPVAYKMNKNTWEYQDLGASAPCKATVTVQSWEQEDLTKKGTLEKYTKEIPVYIDTTAHIDSTVKKAEAYLLTNAEAASKMGIDLSDLNEDGVEYRYALWSVTSDISDVTQKYALNLTDTATDLTGTDAEGNLHTVKGEVVGIKMGGTYFANTEASLSGLTSSGKRTDYVLTRYPYESSDDNDGVKTLENAPKNAVYTANNEVKVELNPADGQDKSTEAESSALFRFEQKNPVWLPVEERYSANKWGLYNNGTQRVGNKSNVSSYELAEILDDTPVSGIMYETYAAAHAYGKTVSDLNDIITQMILSENKEEGIITITAGSRVYTFSSSDDATEYQLTINGGEPETIVIPNGYETLDGQFKSYSNPLTSLDMQRIAAQDIADNYYGQKALDYIFEDKTFNLEDKDILSETTPLNEDDYKIDSFSYKYTVKKAIYDADNMEYSAGKANEDFYDEDEDNNILEFYVYNNGSTEPSPVGKYNIRTGEVFDVDSSLVSSISGSNVVFANSANITGYQIKTKNKYFYVELTTKPSVTLKPSTTVKELVDPIINGENITEKKIALQNTSNWTMKNVDTELINLDKTGTDYIADIVRTSNINKKALGEKVTIRGQDGKIYQSKNDTLVGQYELAWQTKIYETADGVEVNGEIKNNVPVPQQSGIFYDLLPAHCDIIEGSVNVYVDANGDVNENTKALSPSSFEVLDRIDNYNGSGKKLLIVKVNAPCEKSYTLTYVTVHSHEDISDYGSYVLNTVAYQTGNADIGDGYADDGGDYDVSMSSYIKGLDPNNGDAKRFIYAEATEDILALFPTSSGIYKKVATKSDPTYRRSGVVHNGENYTYSIRMQNDSSTKARDIAILDSIENYRTVNGTTYNSGIKTDRDWNGTVVSFDLQGIEDKIAAYVAANEGTKASVSDLKLILYVGNDIVNLNDETYSDSMARKYLLNKILGNTAKAEKNAESLLQVDIDKYDEIAKNWKVVDWKTYKDASGAKVDLSEVTAFIVYTGEHFVLDKGDSMSFTVVMHTPDEINVSQEKLDNLNPANGVFLNRPMTYNNIYRSFTTLPKDAADNIGEDRVIYFYTHYDYTQLQYNTIGTLKFTKADQKTNVPMEGIEFNLSGISDYGKSYNETLISDNNGIVMFKDLERGTYQLIESVSDPDHKFDTTPRTVTVDPRGKVTIVTVDGVVVDDGAGNYTIYNEPRYHGDLEFSKIDSLSGDGISGVKFRLSGTSIYNNKLQTKIYDENGVEKILDYIEATSGANGKVVFEDIEKGEYTLTEVIPANGYLPPIVNTYSVTCSGEENLIFTITGESVEYKKAEYQIKNTPTAKMTLQKVDSITKAVLDDAKFILTAESSNLNAIFENLNAKGIETGWEKSDGKWVQTIDGGNAGKYIFTYLPEGKYTLTEDKAPTGYAEISNSYTINVVKSSDGKALLIQLPETNDMKYIKLEGGDFTETDKENATYYRLLNDETYEDGKTVVKSWVGGVDGNFPSLHLSTSTEKPEAESIKVTIGSAFKTLVQNNKSNFTGLTKETTLPSGKTMMVDRTRDSENETGVFYAWWDNTDKKVHWYSDADIIYLPRDCISLFSNCKNPEFTELDLSPFNFEKVETMRQMFDSCSNLQEVDMSTMITTPKLFSLSNMFVNCNALQHMDWSNWVSSSTNISKPYALNFRSTFKDCNSMEWFLMPNLVTDKVGTLRQMFCRTAKLKKVVLGKNMSFVDYTATNGNEPNNYQLNDGTSIRSMNGIFYCWSDGYTPSNTDTAVFDFSGLNTTNVINMGYMFNTFKSAKTVYVSKNWTTENVISDNDGTKNIFNSSNLVGGLGTKLTDATNNIAHAKIDEAGLPGLFTDINSLTNVQLAELRGISVEEAQAYKEFLANGSPAETSSSSSQNDSSFDISSVSFDNYPNFTKTGTVKQAENTTATSNDAGKTSFTFEYVTAKTAVPASGTTPYEVDETVYMTVSQIVEDSGIYYTVSQKYKYDSTIKAKWTKVGGTAPTQWYCEMMVFNADDEMFAWEDEVDDFVSTSDVKNPIKTKGKDNKPVITNSKSPVGNLELSKRLTGTSSEKYSRDEFWFKVTMWTDSTKITTYNMLPFENGVAYFKVRANASDDDKVIIKGIPADYTYTVEEIKDADHPMPDGYNISEEKPSGTIVANSTQIAAITNTINTADLSLTKNVELWKKTNEQPNGLQITAQTDTDYAEWKNQDFTFTVTFSNLVMGQEYSYKVGDKVQAITGNDKSAETVKTITIKGGQTVTFLNIPVGTKYTIVETSEFENTDTITYTTTNNKSNADGKSTAEQVLSANDTVTFINTKTIDETQTDETVEVTINKEWYSEDGKPVHWMKNDTGNVVKFRYDEATDSYIEDSDKGSYIPMDSEGKILKNYPSFLKVYLGRALKVGDGENAVYLDILTGYESASLNIKGDWSYTFTDLEKYGEVTLNGEPTKCPYVYFVTEVVPIGFSNINTDKTKIGTEEYFTATGSDDTFSFTLKNQEDKTFELSVCKLVTGNFGNKAKDFQFEVEFKTKDENGKWKPLQGTGFTMRFTDVYDSTYVRNRTYTLENGKVSIDLPHGKKVQFLGIPKGTQYTITEISSDGYKTVSGTYTGDPTTIDTSSWTEQKSCTDTLTDNVNYLYVNDLTGTLPTGIDMKNNIIVLTALTISTCLILMWLKKHRKYEEERT